LAQFANTNANVDLDLGADRVENLVGALIVSLIPHDAALRTVDP